MQKQYYLNLRKAYQPETTRIIFVLESPPASGKYFYNPDGPITEPLFKAMMKNVLKSQTASKADGLRMFKDAGCIIVDSTYTPVNHMPDSQADKVILEDYPELIEDLRKLARDSDPAIILVKANVCRLLEKRLLHDGFNVVNRGRVIYFPSTGRQLEFQKQIEAVMSSVTGPQS